MDKLLFVRKEWLNQKRIRGILLTIACILALVLPQVLMRYFIQQNLEISEVFLASQATTDSCSLEIAGQYRTKSLTESEKKQILISIADSIGLEISDGDFARETDEKVSKVTVNRESKAATTKLQLVSINVNQEGEIPVIQNYILVRMELGDQIDSIMGYKERIKGSFKELEVVDESSYVQFTGSYSGKLTIDHKNEIADQMIKKLRGHVTYENRTDDLYTVYAYSGSIEDYISVGRSKVNVQVAMRYDEIKDETVLYLATPILNGSY